MVNLGLEGFSNKTKKPSFIESVHYLFFEKGIGLTEFNELPIPYILSMVKVQSYKLEQEEKAIKKNKR